MRLGCTSYVYPDGLVSNAERLAGVADDIELLVFEGADRAVLPTRDEVLLLARIAEEHGDGFSYTVHLPLDLDVCAAEGRFREFSLDRMEEIASLTEPLSPEGFVLHLPGGEDGGDGWTVAALAAAERLSLLCAPLFVENLKYPFTRLEPVFADSKAMLCLDIGHALAAGDDWREIYGKFGQRTAAIHLYAPDKGSGRHLGLRNAPSGFVSGVTDTLLSSGYGGVLTIELFGEEEFFSSKEIVDAEMRNWAQR